jgi:cation diffusion facilitator CzcD-associated flavoprotein CzcO
MVDAATIDREIDVLVIGAGVAGIRQLIELREQDLDVYAVDAAGGVGGTWWWNRYPGCRFDSESYTYNYFFDKAVLDEWRWTEHFASQPEIEGYLNYVVDKYGVRDRIVLGTRVDRLEWDEDAHRWTVSLSSGTTVRPRFVVTGIGRLSQPQYPIEPGRETFRGEQYHTAVWPEDVEVDFTGKRVALIGAGSSAVQIAPLIADVADSLTIYQRRPNWVAPLHNTPITDEEMARIKADFDEIIRRCNVNPAGFVHLFDPRNPFEITAEERRELYEKLWASPGFGNMFGNFKEVLSDAEINKEYSAFVAEKIRERVHDQDLATRLIPSDHGYGAKRPPHETRYYEIFNEPHVSLVTLTQTPILAFTEDGIRTTEGEQEFDMIVYATGFDAITGAFDVIDIEADGRRLKDEWREGPQTHMGFATPGFPNLFYLGGPQTGGGNAPRCLEPQSVIVGRLIREANERGATKVDATLESAAAWTEHVNATAAMTLTAKANTKVDWMWGANTPGKKLVYRSYVAGVPVYFGKVEDMIEQGWAGFEMTSVRAEVGA